MACLPSIGTVISMAGTGLVQGRSLLPRLVGPVAVVVPRVLAQDLPQVPVAEDQQMIQALAAQRAHETFRESVRPRRPDRGLDDPCAVPGKDLIKCCSELAVAVADQEPEGAGAITEVYEQVAGLLGGPGPSRGAR